MTPRQARILAHLQRSASELAEAFKLATGAPTREPSMIAAILKAKRDNADAIASVTGGHKIALAELLAP